MPDREKVINALEDYEPYAREFDSLSVYGWVVLDALDLLKEQEEIKPKQVGLYGKDAWYGLVCVCPDCKAEWMSYESETHFCPNCGQEVKWE